ncbi:MAG: hypothetical protein LBL66_04070 [Clostridiales bacterium]|jgi:hypothetical protein|nr:hypothetical protein [Clostridiales bacterium]
MFPFFGNWDGGFGCGGCGGWGYGRGGPFFGGPCGKCGHCCYCNRNALLLQAAFLAASCCRNNRNYGGNFDDFGKIFNGAGFGFGGGLTCPRRPAPQETPPEDLRGRRGGGYRYG